MSGPPPLKRVLSEREALAPEEARGLIGDFSASSLAQNGVFIRDLEWLVPVTSVHLRSGRVLQNGFCGSTLDGRLHVFRYTDTDGFRFISGAPNEAKPAVEEGSGNPVLTLAFAGAGPIQLIKITVNQSLARASLGNWIALWNPAISAAMGSCEQEVGLISIEHYAPANHEFGLRKVISVEAVFCSLAEDGPRFFPAVQMPGFIPRKWWTGEARVSVWIEHESVPNVIEVREHVIARKWPVVEQFRTMLASVPRAQLALSHELSSLGVFTVQFAVGAPPQSRVIKKDGSELWLRDLADGEPTCFRYGFAYHEAVILIAENGAWACVQLLEKDAQHFSSGLMPPEDLKAGDDAPFWAVVLRDANGVSPVRITIFEDHATLDEHERIPLQNARKLHVAPLGDGFCSVTIDFDETSAKMAVKLIAPEAVAYKIWQEWDVRRTRTGIADAAAADLYKQFNEAKKYNLLSALFADVVLLNRELNSKISMDDLMAELESKGPVEFSEDKRLRELTISKMVLLISVLPRIKQKFELLAAMYPYYWAQQEASWLEMIFGKARVAGVVTAQTRRIVPVVRREVRSMQANVQRALGEIEASLRPLDALFAREEVQKSGWSKIRRWAPVAVKAAAVGAMPFVPHVAIPYLIMQAGGFFAGDVLGNVCGIFLKDSETHSQFQRAAKSVFPWWQIFMRTLVISIYEAAQFIDDENIRAMKRDKQLFDQVPATEKPATLQTLSTELRKRIIQERRNYFAEISAGSGLRLSNVIDDIQASIGKEVNQFVAEFTQGVTLSNKTKNRDMP